MVFLRSLLFVLCLLCMELQAKPLTLNVEAEAAILMNADTGVILYEKQAHTLHYPASITKIATASYALKVAGNKLDQIIAADQDSVASISEEARKKSKYTVPAYWLIPGGSHIGIKKDEELSLKDLLYGTLVASGNDAANVIAQYVGGTIPQFMKELNQYLQEIGCQHTTFYNPHGLFHPKHQTTAYDMALVMCEALKNPTFCEMISTVRYTRPKTNKQESTVLLQTNKLIRKGQYNYPKAIGGKTGYLSAAGYTLVVAAEHEGRTLIAVLLGCNDSNERFSEAIKMFEAAYTQPKVQRILLRKGSQKFTLDLDGASSSISTYIKDDLILDYYSAEEPSIKCLLYWAKLHPPIAKDQPVGEIHIINSEGTPLQKATLFADSDVSATWFWRLRHPF